MNDGIETNENGQSNPILDMLRSTKPLDGIVGEMRGRLTREAVAEYLQTMAATMEDEDADILMDAAAILEEGPSV